jgi:hypothetical protein
MENARNRITETFSYKGKKVSVTETEHDATMGIDGGEYVAERLPGNRMFRVAGVHNVYASAADLARHIIDYQHLVPAPKAADRREKGGR